MRALWIVFLVAVLILIVVLLAGPSLATNFYVVINTATDSCHVVLEEPDGEVMKQLGGPYASYDEATAAMKELDQCGGKERYR